eukprot:gene22365-biopygen7200
MVRYVLYQHAPFDGVTAISTNMAFKIHVRWAVCRLPGSPARTRIQHARANTALRELSGLRGGGEGQAQFVPLFSAATKQRRSTTSIRSIDQWNWTALCQH